MNKIPVYEVIDQQPMRQDDQSTAIHSVFKPLIGDECTVALSDVRPSDGLDCSSSAVFGGDIVGEYRRVLVLGETECMLDRGLEAVLYMMRPNELHEFCLGDGRGGRVAGRIRLMAVRKHVGVAWRTDDRLKLAEATRYKDAGNRLYRLTRYADAFHMFNRSIGAVLFVRHVDAAGRDARDALYVTVCNNMAACQLQLGNYSHARRLSYKALAVDPGNLKALVRRCRASVELRMFDEALADARLALDRDPDNAVVKRYMDVATRGVHDQNEQYKDMVKKMFA